MAGSGDQIETAIILWNSLQYAVNVADKCSLFKEDLREFHSMLFHCFCDS